MVKLRTLALLGAVAWVSAGWVAGGAEAQPRSSLELATPYRPSSPDARTPETVQAADDAWSRAEEGGDVAYVDWLLLPGYRSVGHAGEITTKDGILASTRQHAGSAEWATKVAAWKAAHPIRPEVSIFGDTAVLTWFTTKPGTSEPISSVDVFAYRGGHWHAVYSQHTDASA
jgi:hypothetical protein